MVVLEMPVPKSVVKIKQDGIEYTSNIDATCYTMQELTRAALRDAGKLICKRFKQNYYAKFPKKTGKVGKFTQYWVKYKQKRPCVEIGIKPNGFYGGFQELGSSKQSKLGLLSSAVEDNIDEIRKIESQYLSYIEDEMKAKSVISDEDYEGGADS